jgi:uncharacterized protein (TIGR00251 family)
MRLSVRVTPRASAERIDGFGDTGALRIHVTAPPADGQANAAVVRLLAKALGLPARDIVLVSGATNRNKVFEVPLELGELEARLRKS